MLEIQCTSCYTRYRVDPRVLPEDTPTFKCSRCGHVFSVEPRGAAQPPAHHSEPPAASSGASEKQSEQHERAAGAAQTAPEPPAHPAASEAPTRESRPAPHTEPPEEDAVAHASASRDDLIERPHLEQGAEPPAAPHNLAFDFHDAPTTEEKPPLENPAPASDQWQVGEEPAAEFDEPTLDDFNERPETPAGEFVREVPASDTSGLRAHTAIERLRTAAQEIPDEVAYLAAREGTHSVGFFVAVFCVIAVAFAVLTLIISNAPTASAAFLDHLPAVASHFTPGTTPAALVTIGAVKASYEPIRGDRSALIVSGTANNRGAGPLHAVEIGASLLDAGKRSVAGQSVALGNTLSDAMIAQMTPHELAFYQKLEAPAGYVLAPGSSAPFRVVFVTPPTSARTVRLAVTEAEPPQSQEQPSRRQPAP